MSLSCLRFAVLFLAVTMVSACEGPYPAGNATSAASDDRGDGGGGYGGY
jgi:hypothetical protein